MIFIKDGRLRPVLRVVVFAAVWTVALAIVGGIAWLSGPPPSPAAMLTYPYELKFEVATCVATILAAFVLRRALDKRSIASLGLAFRSGWLRLFAIGALLGCGMQCFVFALERIAGCSRVTGFAPITSDGVELAQYIPFFVVVAVTEELMVRGYVFQNLWEEFGMPVAAVLSAALFAALHLHNPNSHADLAFTVAGLAAFGIWACLSVVWTRSLWLVVGVHFAWNLFEGPVFGFPVSGLGFGTTMIAQTFSGPAWFTGGPFGPESGFSALAALVAGLAVLYWLYRRGAFARGDDSRESYARTVA